MKKQKLPILPTRGKYFKKEEWYSICSAHFVHDPECPTCNTGRWVNVYGHVIEGFIYKYAYWLWFWWVNRDKDLKLTKFDDK